MLKSFLPSFRIDASVLPLLISFQSSIDSRNVEGLHSDATCKNHFRIAIIHDGTTRFLFSLLHKIGPHHDELSLFIRRSENHMKIILLLGSEGQVNKYSSDGEIT